MHTLLQTFIEALPEHIQMAMFVMDSSTFYQCSAIAIAAPIVAAAAMSHWRRHRTWLALVVIVELASFAAMVLMAMAFDVIDFFNPRRSDGDYLVLPLCWIVAIVLSHAFDGVAAAARFARQRVADRRMVDALVTPDANATSEQKTSA